MIKDQQSPSSDCACFWDNPWTNRSYLWLDKNVIGILSSPVPAEFLTPTPHRPLRTSVTICSLSSACGSSGIKSYSAVTAHLIKTDRPAQDTSSSVRWNMLTASSCSSSTISLNPLKQASLVLLHFQTLSRATEQDVIYYHRLCRYVFSCIKYISEEETSLYSFRYILW